MSSRVASGQLGATAIEALFYFFFYPFVVILLNTFSFIKQENLSRRPDTVYSASDGARTGSGWHCEGSSPRSGALRGCAKMEERMTHV